MKGMRRLEGWDPATARRGRRTTKARRRRRSSSAYRVHRFQCDIQVQECGTCFIYFPSELSWTRCICITLYTLYTLHLRTSLGTLLVKRMLGASVGKLKQRMVDSKAGKFIDRAAVEIVSGISDSRMSLMPETWKTVFTRVLAACTPPVQRLIVFFVRNMADNEVVKMILRAGMRYALNLGHGKLHMQSHGRDSIFAWCHCLSCQSLCPFC